MKRVLVILMGVALVVGLAVPAWALDGYHEVLRLESGLWVSTNKATMFSEGSFSCQYRFESGTVPIGQTTYVLPYPETAPGGVAKCRFDVLNDVYLYPWIEAHITENHMTWDIFKPGTYLAKAFIVQVQANCDVQIHMGGGTWWIPGSAVGEGSGAITHQKFNVEIPPVEHIDNADDTKIEDKPRERGLLVDVAGAEKNPDGTDPDEIEVFYAYYKVTDGTKPDQHTILPAELTAIGSWVAADDLNCDTIYFYDSDALHTPNKHHAVFFEKLVVEHCDSEGYYTDSFAVTVTPDP